VKSGIPKLSMRERMLQMKKQREGTATNDETIVISVSTNKPSFD
jgi:hypothetical protein